MNTDLPLVDVNDDKLGRSIFAEEIANGLVKSFETNNESIVVGVNGSWGSGKSTLINFIISEIQKISQLNHQDIITISFNPWMFSGQKELQNIFLKELFTKLEKNKAKFKDTSQKIAEFLGHLNWLKYVHSGAGEAIKDSKEFLEGVSKGKDLNDLKKEIDELLIKSKIKLYITIDDIDRLLPSEVTDIFQLVKLNGNFANTVFILAYDREVVESALEKQFGKNGKKYIEKIVQVDYTLPNVPKDILSRVLYDHLEQLFPDGEIKKSIINIVENLKNSPFPDYFKTLRDIYRFNNSIKLRLASVYMELNLFEYFLIEALRLFDYFAFDFILKNKELFVHKKQEANLSLRSNQNSFDSALEKNDFQPTTIAIIKSIFGVTNYYSLQDSGNLIREKRAANANYFDRYFNLQLGAGDIPEKFFNAFLSNREVEVKIEILKQVKQEGNLFNFLLWAGIKGKKLDQDDTSSIIESSVIFLSTLTFKKEFFWGWDSDYMTVIRFISGIIENISTPLSRQKILLEKLDKLDRDQYAVFWVSDTILHAFNLFESGKLNTRNLWYDLFPYNYNVDEGKSFAKEIRSRHKLTTQNLFNNEIKERHLNEDELSAVLDAFSTYSPKMYDRKFPLLLEDDLYLVRLVWLCLKRAYMHSGEQLGYQLASYQFLRGLDPETIKKRFTKLNLELIDDDEKKVVDIFNMAYLDGFVEGTYYDIKTLAKMVR